MAANACWGVEVGLAALKAVKLVRTNDGVEVADWMILPHKRVLSAPETDEKDTKRVAVGTLVSQKDLTKASLAVSVAGSQAFARFAKLPPVEAKKIPDIVKFEAVQQIPFPIEDVEWDYQTFVSPDSGIPDMQEVEVGIFAMTRDRVQEKLDKWGDVGRTPDVLTLSPLAAYNALAYDLQFSEKMQGTVILDIGTTSTDLVVAEGGRLWIRTFPIGGHQFTEALVTAFNLSYLKAEKLKKEAESSSAARHVLQAMRPVFGDLAQDVQRSIGYYTSLHREAKLTRLIGLGATWHLPGLRKFLSQQLSMEVVRLEGFQRLKLDDAEKDKDFQAEAVNLCTAYGLALQGLGLQTIDANLIPIAATRKAVWADKTKYFVGAAALLMLAGGAAFVRPLMDQAAIASAPRPASVIDDVKRRAQELKSEWTQVESEDKPDPRAGVAMNLLADRDVHAHLLRDLADVMKSADDKLPTPAGEPARVAMKAWTTTFVPPGAGGAAAAPADPNAPAPVDRGRVRNDLEIVIAKPEAQGDVFVRDTVQAWLYAHGAPRPGVPYVIDVKSISYRAAGEQKIEATGQPGAGAPPAPGPVRPPDDRLPGAGGPGGGRPPVGGGGPPIRPPVGGGGGAAPPTPGQSGEADALAPLPPSSPAGKPGDTLTTYRISWEVILTPPAAAKKEGGQ